MLLMNEEKTTKMDLISWGMLLVLFLYMFALNFLMPLHRDDYWYALIWGTTDRITSWPDIIQSLYTHYFTHGGRMVSFLILDSFLLLGKQWFNFLNAFLFVALIVLIYWHSQRKLTLRFNPYILLLITVFTWLGLPHFGEVCIWMTGACVYLLTAVLIFAFLLPYHFSLLGNPLWKDSYVTAAGMFFGGIIAGWTVENTAATMTFIILGAVFYAHRTHSLTKWMVTGCIGSLIGFLLLIIAPGNYVRAGESKTALIYHFTNQIAAGGELLLYVFPVVWFLIFVWRILVADYAEKKHLAVDRAASAAQYQFSSFLIIGILLLMIFSYLNNGFVSKWLGSLIYDNVAVRLGIATSHLQKQFFNTMSGLEEMLVYLLAIAQIYRYTFKKLALRKKDIKGLLSALTWRDIVAAYPASKYVMAWLALAVVNNLVMIASPRFPGRATFGTAVFLIIGAVSVFTIPEVYKYLLVNARKKYMAFFCAIVLIPMTAVVLRQEVILYQEDGARMAYLETKVEEGASSVEIPPISFKNRVLRHIYFEDLTNDGTRAFLCNYYRLKNITLKQ